MKYIYLNKNHLVAFLMALCMSGINLQAKTSEGAENIKADFLNVLHECHHEEREHQLADVLDDIIEAFNLVIDLHGENNEPKTVRVARLEEKIKRLSEFQATLKADKHKKIKALSKDMEKVIKDLHIIVGALKGFNTYSFTELAKLSLTLDQYKYLLTTDIKTAYKEDKDKVKRCLKRMIEC